MTLEEIKEKIIGTYLFQDWRYCGKVTMVFQEDGKDPIVELMINVSGLPIFAHAPFCSDVLERLAKNGFAESPVSGEENKTTCYKLFRDYEKD